MLTAREFEQIKMFHWNGMPEKMVEFLSTFVAEDDEDDEDERTRFDPEDDDIGLKGLHELTNAIKEQSRMYDLFVTKLFDRLERNREQLAPTIVEAIKVAWVDLRGGE